VVSDARVNVSLGNLPALQAKSSGISKRNLRCGNYALLSIEVKTSFANFKAGSWKPGNWLIGSTGGATWYGLDGKVLSARGSYDSIGVSVPVGAVSLSATAYEPSGLIGEATGNAGTIKQQNTTFGLGYAAGAMSLSAGYITYNNQSNPVVTDASIKNVTRVAAKYEFGASSVGAGLANYSLGDGGTNTQTLISASTSVGALSFNVKWASNKVDVAATSAIAATNGTRSGYMLGAQYNLSKRT
jgi:predicted porin